MLELIDLRRRFGDVVALDGVSFEVPEGHIVGFVGRNGAGKTTAMRIALGVLQADEGSVRWRGAAVDMATAGRADVCRSAPAAASRCWSPRPS